MISFRLGNVSSFNTRIGVAEQHALAGEKLLVTTFGGTTRQFGGLTPGSDYYVVNDGIALDGTLRIGVALTPDTLMIMR